MNWKKFAVILILLFSSESLGGEEPWTLERCLDYAYQNSPVLRAAQQSVKEAQGLARAASSILFPQLTVNATYTRNSPAPLGSFGGSLPSGRIRPSLISADVYESGLGINYTFFSWRIKPTLDIFSASVDQVEEDFKKVKNDLTLAVKKAYFTVLFNNQLVNITTQAVDVAKTNFETTQKLYNEGKVSHFDVSRAKVRWINSQSDFIDAKNTYDIALEGLKATLSLPVDEELKISGKLPEEIIEVSLEEALKTAYDNRPELRSLDYLKNLSASTVALEKAARLPSFSLSYNYSWQGQDLYSNPDNYYKSWTLLGKISIPIFDGFTAKGRIRAAEANLERVKQSQKQLLDAINLEVKQAYLSLRAAKERTTAQKENVVTAQENLRIATERYKLGLLSQLELKDAELSVIEAETNYSRALYDYNIGLADLKRAQGLE